VFERKIDPYGLRIEKDVTYHDECENDYDTEMLVFAEL
jgi:hypothetical protein